MRTRRIRPGPSRRRALRATFARISTASRSSARSETMSAGTAPSAALLPANGLRCLAFEVAFVFGIRMHPAHRELRVRDLPRADLLQIDDAGDLREERATRRVALTIDVAAREDVRAR